MQVTETNSKCLKYKFLPFHLTQESQDGMASAYLGSRAEKYLQDLVPRSLQLSSFFLSC